MHTHSDNTPSAAAAYSDPIQLMSRFYQQVVEIKRWIETGKLASKVAQQLKLSRAPTDEEMAEAISLRLQRWIEQTRLNAGKLLTDRECNLMEEALFVMAALADELFIMELNWPGRDHWEMVLLEEKVFHSCYAGEQFFTGVAGLLNERALDPQQQKLAAVYLLALRLGFAGRFRDKPQKLAYFRQQLFKRLSVGGQDSDTPVCPQAYEYVMASWQEQRLAPLAGWYRVMALGALAYLSVGGGIWLLLKGSWG